MNNGAYRAERGVYGRRGMAEGGRDARPTEAERAVYGGRGTALRVVYLLGALAAWGATMGGRLGSRRAVVLCYHGVSGAQRARFERQVGLVRGRVVGIEEGERPARLLSARRVCLTFDDAFASLLRNALPVTAGAAAPATVFAVSRNLGRAPAWEMEPGHPDRAEPVMTEAQLRDVDRLPGCRVGSHGATHRALACSSHAEAVDELRASKADLEELLGRGVEDFAAPYGSYTPEIAALARTLGYRRFFTQDPSAARPTEGIIGRFQMSPDVWPVEFLLTAAGAYGWVYRLRRVVRRTRGLAAVSLAASRPPMVGSRA